MKHIYSDHLVAYLFNEIDSDTKQSLEKELACNMFLRNDLQELKDSLAMLTNCSPLSPSDQSIENIISISKAEDIILAD